MGTKKKKMKSKSNKGKRRGAAESRGLQNQKRGDDGFLIAAIGASAGGVEASTELFRSLPSDTGMAFVLVQHLDPNHQSILKDLISKTTKMPVDQVSDGVIMRLNGGDLFILQKDHPRSNAFRGNDVLGSNRLLHAISL